MTNTKRKNEHGESGCSCWACRKDKKVDQTKRTEKKKKLKFN